MIESYVITLDMRVPEVSERSPLRCRGDTKCCCRQATPKNLRSKAPVPWLSAPSARSHGEGAADRSSERDRPLFEDGDFRGDIRCRWLS